MRLKLATASGRLLLRREQAVTLHLLSRELSAAADGFRFFSSALFRGFLIGPAALHFAKHAFALELFLQDAQRLVDIVFSDENLQRVTSLMLIVGACRLTWRKRPA